MRPVTLSLCSKSARSFEAETEGMSGVQIFFCHIFICCLYCTSQCPVGNVWRAKHGVDGGGQDKGKTTLRDFFAESEDIVEVIVFHDSIIICFYDDLCGPLYIFKAVCGVIHSLWCTCTAPHQFSCTSNSKRKKKRLLCPFIASLLLSTKPPVTIVALSCVGTFFRPQWGLLMKCVIVLSLIYQLLFVDRKQRDIFGNKHFFVPCFGIRLCFCLSEDFFCL